jgi:hypothetical protein
MWKFSESNTGEFVEKSHGHGFTFRETSNEWALQNGLKYEIDVLDGVRFANIKVTVAYVAVDEAADGTAVLEKWDIRNRKIYANL